jgi:hypothetical protein
MEKYLKNLKDSCRCRGCKGSCAIDWAPDGFTNYTLIGEYGPSSLEPMINYIFYADAEIPVLTRQIMNGGREPDKY